VLQKIGPACAHPNHSSSERAKGEGEQPCHLPSELIVEKSPRPWLANKELNRCRYALVIFWICA
jgi:hypothetical protein